MKGFTLVELLVVIAILGILAAIAVTSFLNEVYLANGAKLRTYLQTIDSAIALAQANGWQVTTVADISNQAQCPVLLAQVLGNLPIPPRGMYKTSLTPVPTLVPAAVYSINAAGQAVCGGVRSNQI